MNPTGLTIAGGGGGTALLAECLQYLTHWPLQPMDQNTSLAFAGVLIGLGGLLTHFLQNKKGKDSQP